MKYLAVVVTDLIRIRGGCHFTVAVLAMFSLDQYQYTDLKITVQNLHPIYLSSVYLRFTEYVILSLLPVIFHNDDNVIWSYFHCGLNFSFHYTDVATKYSTQIFGFLTLLSLYFIQDRIMLNAFHSKTSLPLHVYNYCQVLRCRHTVAISAATLLRVVVVRGSHAVGRGSFYGRISLQ